jgi:hypothetical protein
MKYVSPEASSWAIAFRVGRAPSCFGFHTSMQSRSGITSPSWRRARI